jgi:hypothetical protein
MDNKLNGEKSCISRLAMAQHEKNCFFISILDGLDYAKKNISG